MKIRRLIKANPKLHRCFTYVFGKIMVFIGRISPRLQIEFNYRIYFSRPINLKNPHNICEKICWMNLYGDTSLWSRCSDKYLVREFVQERGLGFTLNTLLGVYEKAEDINFDDMPSKFVLKGNNGGGHKAIMIINDKTKIDNKRVCKTVNQWLKLKDFERHAECHYKKIRPLIIAEKYLEHKDNESSLVDYKFYCFNGKVHSILLCTDRDDNGVNLSSYDLEWNLHPENMDEKHRANVIHPKPKSLEKMIKYSEIMSAGIPFVRVDWYEIDDEPVFGELTFTPACGFLYYHSMNYLCELGEKCVLPEKRK